LSQEREIVPREQQTLLFYGKPIVVVRLADGRPAVVLSSLCENLQIDTNAQVMRIRRTEAISEDLVFVQVQTDGGPQRLTALILRSVPFWLAGIDPKRVREEIRPDIIRYQREVVDVLYAWAQAPKVAPPALVPVEPMSRPVQPSPTAPADEWATYHEQMALFYRWKRTVDARLDTVDMRLGEVESRLDEQRRVLAFIPEILERLGPEKMTAEHYRQVQVLAKQLHQATGKPFPTIYEELKTVFEKPRIEDLLEEDWLQVEQWFKVQIERGKKKS
jgi:hypothetical protein